MFLLLVLLLALQSQQAIKLKRFEILRVDPAGMNRLPPSLRAFFADPVPDAEPVASLNEAAMRAGFTPRLPKSATPIQLGVTDPVHTDARTLRQKFAANPALFFPIPIPYEMDIHEVRLNSGPGLLLQNGSKIGDLALVWSTADHIYFLTGALTETQAIELVNSIQ